MPGDRGTAVRHDGRVPVLDLSLELSCKPARRALDVSYEVAVAAARAASWSGEVLPLAEVLGVAVYPVVEFTGAAQRLGSGVGPERCLTELELWESGWADDASRLGVSVPPPPLRVVGFIMAAARWERALRGAHAVGGLGSALLVQREPKMMQLLEADVAGVWVVASGARLEAAVLVHGRVGPVATARRVPATRLIEEGLFAHACKCGMLDAVKPPSVT